MVIQLLATKSTSTNIEKMMFVVGAQHFRIMKMLITRRGNLTEDAKAAVIAEEIEEIGVVNHAVEIEMMLRVIATLAEEEKEIVEMTVKRVR